MEFPTAHRDYRRKRTSGGVVDFYRLHRDKAYVWVTRATEKGKITVLYSNTFATRSEAKKWMVFPEGF